MYRRAVFASMPSVKNSTKKPSSGRKVPSLRGGRRARVVRRIVSTDKSAKTLVARAPSVAYGASSLPEGAYKKPSPLGEGVLRRWQNAQKDEF